MPSHLPTVGERSASKEGSVRFVSTVSQVTAFTMVEILSALAIIAVLVAVMVPAIGNYVETARKTADKQTLMVLNDALNRYKTQGGDLTALTAGAIIGNILTKMKTPVTWAGVGHKFLNEGVTYGGASLSAVGSGAQYRFTKYGDYADGTEYSNGIIDSYAANGYDVGDEEEFESWLAQAMSDTGSTNYLALENPATTDRIGFYARVLNNGDKVRVWWGDGTTENFDSISTSSNTAIAKVYGSLAKRTVVIVGDVSYVYSNSNAGIGGAEATAFGGNISTMKSLTYINIHGSNTISGSINELAALTYLSITGSNTISGDISSKTGFTYLNADGNNSITGDITNLSALTYLRVLGNNTISGNIDGRTNFTRIQLEGSNTVTGDISGNSNLNVLVANGNTTITGSIAGMPLEYLRLGAGSTIDIDSVVSVSGTATGLCYFNTASTSNYPLTSTQVDTILGNFWTNRDAAKPRSERHISINQSNQAAPSATGQTYKSNLQGYMSPNNTGPSVWTVNTN